MKISRFEEYLIDNGYSKYRMDNHQQEKEGKHEVSSLTNLGYWYKKEGYKTIGFGLNERGHPPTLDMFTRPVKLMEGHNRVPTAHEIDVMFDIYSFEEIIKAI